MAKLHPPSQGTSLVAWRDGKQELPGETQGLTLPITLIPELAPRSSIPVGAPLGLPELLL
ncbi:unnamed protein product [Lupinus luteus]|uniref:Uncharacterized protein n=1 Tax=Lupinus luteus TaxID=3873 RepID=A0AAV1VQQ9_LUPLU